MIEEWKDVEGYEGRYQVSNMGKLRSVPFLQRYLLRTGEPAFRLTRQKSIATQPINSGYLIAHLHKDGKRKAVLVHRLVAGAFIGPGEVNHINGLKTDNHLSNLEIVTRTENHLHAVRLGLNKQAIRVMDSRSGVRYYSMTQAARATGHSMGYVSRNFVRLT